MTKKIIFLFLLINMISNIVLSQKTAALSVGEKVTKTIGLDEKHNYSIKLKKGQFAVLNIEQQKMDVKIVTYSPNGKQIEKFDSLNGNTGDELILLDGLEDGEYSVEVIPFKEKKWKSGNYEIELIAINQDVHKHLNQVLQTSYDRGILPGFAVSIVNKDTILYEKATGYSKIESKTPYTQQTVQSIASISKTFIGISLMMMVEEGKLNLDTPINDILPFEVTNPYFPKKPITLRHLATHTSSINDFPHYYTKAGVLLEDLPIEMAKYPKDIQKVLKMAMANEDMNMIEFTKKMLTKEGEWYKKKNFFKKPPGQEWFYSNVGAVLAAYIVELVSGISYDAFVRTRIMEPLQLQSATWSAAEVDAKKLTSSYTRGTLLLPTLKIITYPDGGVYMSSENLGKYLMFLMKGYEGEARLISANSFQEIMKIQHEEKQGDHQGTKNGIFWWQSKDGFIGHNGGDTGTIAIMKFNLETKLGITFLSNMSPTESDASLIPFEKVYFALKRYSTYLQK